MNFKELIIREMQAASISHAKACAIYEKHANVFLQAFTHSSFGGANYEMLEASGDHVLNNALFHILWRKYPQLNQKTITFAFHKAKSEECLYRVGAEHGFFAYIRMSPEYLQEAINWRDNYNREDFTTNSDMNVYVKLLEDVVESFCGALFLAVNTYTECMMGPGTEVVYKWAIPIIENLNFDPLNVVSTQNIKQQVKEFWDVVYIREIENGHRNQNYLMFPKDNNKSVAGKVWVNIMDPYKKIRLGSRYGYNEKNAHHNASIYILPILKEKYAAEYASGQEYITKMKKNRIN